MLLCGLYEREITPPLGGHMPGGFRTHIAKGVKSRLFVKAAALENVNKRAIIISVDALTLNTETHDKIVERITKFTGIKCNDILISATHSHTAGATIPRGEFTLYDEAYMDMLIKSAADCAILAFQRMVPVTVKYGACEVEGITFNRNIKMKDGSVRTNPPAGSPDIVGPLGTVDSEFTAVYFINEAGEPIGIMSNYACHHCCVGDSYYCADYSGAMAVELKKHFGLGFVSLFINGACGNLNCFDHQVWDQFREEYSLPRYIEMGKILAEKAIAVYNDAKLVNTDVLSSIKERIEVKKRKIPKELVEETNRLFETIQLPKGAGRHLYDISDPNSDMYKRVRAGSVKAMIDLPEKVTVWVQAIRIGDIMIYALPFEIYTEFGLQLKKESPSLVTIVAEQANGLGEEGGIDSYVPTREAFGTAIYEASIPAACFEPETGYKLVEKALSLGKKLASQN